MSTYRSDLDLARLPSHVAIVMDGNGRWAKQRGLPRTKGHEAGERALFDTVEGALDIGLPVLSVYAFSTENWLRPKSEVQFLMNFDRKLLRRRRDELNERGVQVVWSGRTTRVPRSVLRELEEGIEMTKANTRMVLNICFNYGGRAEIVDAVNRLLDERRGKRSGRLTEKGISRGLYQPNLPDPDLVIRTSGEMRISNFLIWQAAYAEFWFTPVLWPDFNREHLFEAIRDFQKRDRRFGGLS
ncbi:MAG: polyprenyl diphosphate synthase [Actinomycetota bacterium]